jgi:hypothetical protein
MPIVAPSLSPASDLVARLYSLTYERHCLAYERDPQSVLLRLWGGNLSVRRSDCGRVPPHSPLFSHRHHEDQDFGIRCLRAGLQGRFCRALRADHRHSGTLSEFASDLLGRLAPSAFTIGLPLPARLIARSGRRPVAGRVLSAVLRASTALCGRLRLTPLATVCAQLLRRTEVVRGAWGAGGWPRQPRWKRPARRDESERIENPRSSKPPQSARNP